MAASADRDTPRKYVERVIDPQPQKGSTTIYAGAMVGNLAADGYARPAADIATMRVIGRASKRSVNAGADGTVKTGQIEHGVFKFANAGSNGLVQADVGGNAYVVDDITVGKAAATSNSIIAGTVDSIDADGGIWVAIGL